MDSIAVTRPHMAVLSQGRLPLSPFGALAQAFAEEVLARAELEEGRYPYVPLELLEELYALQNNQPMSGEQRELSARLIEELWEDRA